jgi:5'-nucleotidase
MRILVTNDDGIGRGGLRVLARRLRRDGHDIVVVAPTRERSGSSSSLGVVTNRATITVHNQQLAGWAGIRAHAIDAPPAAAVRAACSGAFGPTPDLVISGINPGHNTGRVIIHSGTVGAALTAAAMGIAGIAVSTADDSATGYDTAAEVAAWIAADLTARSRPAFALNMNVPSVTLSRLAGIGYAALGAVGIVEIGLRRMTDHLRVTRTATPPPFIPGTDADLLHRGLASLTPLTLPWADPPDLDDIVESLKHRLATVQDLDAPAVERSANPC